MSVGNDAWRSAPYRFVDHRAVSWLFPLEEQPTEAVVQGRDAVRLVEERPTTDFIGIRPSGLASSYDLRQRPLTAIRLSALPAERRERIEGLVASPPADGLLLFGSVDRVSPDHSLAEYGIG